jgi:RNA polymerase sigma-70 factor, ECF subfamily
MSASRNLEPSGPFDGRYLAFLETVTQLRPRLHRYCARMSGSVMDGEDIVQEALFEAYRKLDSFDDSRPLTPWLFRIAHNRCIDFLRRRSVRTKAEAEAIAEMPEFTQPQEPHGHDVAQAVEYLVQLLPPRERACLLLKDVFEYSLEEVADFLGSTTGAVKAALNRGRAKLAIAPSRTPLAVAENQKPNATLREYVTRFNRRDWDGVRDLIRADATVLVADRFSGPASKSPYFGNYERWPASWRLALGRVDGEPAIIALTSGVDTWTPHSVIQVSLTGNRIASITDYGHCAWVLAHARAVTFEQPALLT